MTETVATTGMDAIISAITQVTSVVTSVFTVMTGNAFCVFLLAATCVGIGIGIFSKIRRAAH